MSLLASLNTASVTDLSIWYFGKYCYSCYIWHAVHLSHRQLHLFAMFGSGISTVAKKWGKEDLGNDTIDSSSLHQGSHSGRRLSGPKQSLLLKSFVPSAHWWGTNITKSPIKTEYSISCMIAWVMSNRHYWKLNQPESCHTALEYVLHCIACVHCNQRLWGNSLWSTRICSCPSHVLFCHLFCDQASEDLTCICSFGRALWLNLVRLSVCQWKNAPTDNVKACSARQSPSTILCKRPHSAKERRTRLGIRSASLYPNLTQDALQEISFGGQRQERHEDRLMPQIGRLTSLQRLSLDLDHRQPFVRTGDEFQILQLQSIRRLEVTIEGHCFGWGTLLMDYPSKLPNLRSFTVPAVRSHPTVGDMLPIFALES